MRDEACAFGDVVTITAGEWQGKAGVVSWPISENTPGYVLLCVEGKIAGVRVTPGDVQPSTGPGQNFSQLAYLLLNLSSQVIEKKILPLATHAR